MDSSKKEIMEATCKALEKHGYAQLSIQKIADEFDKSKSLIYHHYDDREDLMLAFLDFMLEQFEEKEVEREDIREKFMETAFMGFEEEGAESMKAFIELRAEGLRDERFRQKFTGFSDAYESKLEKLLEKGIEDDAFKEVEVSNVAEFINAVNKEAIFHRAMGKDEAALKEGLEGYLEHKLLK